MAKHTFGPFLRQKRLEARISLRQLARELEISAVYLGEVERGLKPTLKKERWADLARLVPGVTMAALERHAAESKPLQLDLDDAPVAYKDVSYALARRIENRDLTTSQLTQLMNVLGKAGK